MNKPVRLFFAIELSEQIHLSLQELIRELSPLADRSVKWVEPHNVHLTLKFLGDTPTAFLPKINTTVESLTGQHNTFELIAQGCGVFPNPNRPRILWAGITCPSELTRLQKDLETQLSPLGFASEDRPFSPHLTLGRVNESAAGQKIKNLLTALQGKKAVEFGKVAVHKITLFQSTLTPGGPIYTPLQRFSLAEKA